MAAHDLIRRLAETRPDGARVLSVFVDLDPGAFATGAARAQQVGSLADRAKQAAEQEEGLGHDARAALREDAERVKEALADPQSLGAGDVRGIAVYACGPAGLFEVVRLHHRVEADVVVGATPRLEPLVATGPRERWAVVLVDRQHARVLVGDEDGLEEVRTLESSELGRDQSDRGGPSQANYERSLGDDVRKHLVATAEALRATLEEQGFDRLLVGGSDPNAAALEEQLHAYVRERLAGRIDVDVQRATVADVREAVRPAFDARRTEHESELLDRVRAGLGREDGHAVGGLDGVRDALVQGRVEVLLLERGGPLSERPDDVEEVIGAAVGQSAEVVVLGDRPDLSPLGGVAALLRF